VRLLPVILFAFVLASQAASWYVDSANTGTTNGTSWATAWDELNDVQWGSVSAGDTLYLSGGTTSQAYRTTLTIAAAGTMANPINIRIGQEAGHNGLVVMSNSIYISSINYSNILIDGGKSPTFSTNGINPLTPWGITNNIGNCN